MFYRSLFHCFRSFLLDAVWQHPPATQELEEPFALELRLCRHLRCREILSRGPRLLVLRLLYEKGFGPGESLEAATAAAWAILGGGSSSVGKRELWLSMAKTLRRWATRHVVKAASLGTWPKRRGSRGFVSSLDVTAGTGHRHQPTATRIHGSGSQRSHSPRFR